MGLTTEEKVFIIEHYFRPYGNGKQRRPSLKLVTEKYCTKFHKESPANVVMLSIVEKFCRSGSVLIQWKGRSGRPVTVRINESHGYVVNQVLQSPNWSLRRTSLKLNITNISIQHLVKDVGVFSNLFKTLQDCYEQCLHAHFEHVFYRNNNV